MSHRFVFVLGAGFTRAFVPEAPLLVDDYGIPALRERFRSFSYARAILDNAMAERSDGHVDLERLMTRLGGMPYDNTDAQRETVLLESELRKSLVKRIRQAKAGEVDRKGLDGFARFVLKNEASIVTFNYDDVFDRVLWEVHSVTGTNLQSDAYCIQMVVTDSFADRQWSASRVISLLWTGLALSCSSSTALSIGVRGLENGHPAVQGHFSTMRIGSRIGHAFNTSPATLSPIWNRIRSLFRRSS